MSHRFALRVYWEDTDAAGIVYHANYLKFMERGRSEALIALGLSQTAIREQHRIVFAVREATIRYLSPARLEDQLVVTTRVIRLAGARLEMDQQVSRDDLPLAKCRVILACLGDSGRPVRLPAALRAALAQLMPHP